MTAPSEPTLNFGLRFARVYQLNTSGTPDAIANPDFTEDLLINAGLAIDAVPEKFKTTQTALYTVSGVAYTKTAATALTFTANHVITASKFGVILVQINAAGTISTKVPASPQAYNDAPTALAALPSADSGKVALGYIAIENNAGDWTANTDDLTNGSDLTTASFNDATEVVTAYEGLQIKGSTAFELTVPEPRKITGLGEDGVTQVAYLPPIEGTSGVLTQEATDPDVAAFLDDTTVRTLGEATIMGGATNKQGFEPQIAMILYQAARGLNTGSKYWHTYILPSAQAVKMPGSMTADKAQTRYMIAPNVCNAHLWGEAFTEASDGYTSAQFVELWTNNPVVLTSFTGTGTQTEFVFPTAYPSASNYATSTLVFVNGTQVTSNITITTTKVTFAGGFEPAINARVDIFRELA